MTTALEAHLEYLRKIGASERVIEGIIEEQQELQTISDLTEEKKACIEFIINAYGIKEAILHPARSSKLRNLLERAEKIKEIYDTTQNLTKRKPPIWALLGMHVKYMPTTDDIQKNIHYLRNLLELIEKPNIENIFYNDINKFLLLFQPHAKPARDEIFKALKYS